MLVVDIETSGINPIKNSILSIGAVNFIKPEETFYDECYAFDGAEITDEALSINGFTKEQATDKNKQSEAELVSKFNLWIKEQENDEIIIAGQNISFDYGFLKEAYKRAGMSFEISKRTVDLHSVAYIDMLKKGLKPQRLSLDEILKYVGLSPEPKPHIAINGAKLEREAFQRLLDALDGACK